LTFTQRYNYESIAYSWLLSLTLVWNPNCLFVIFKIIQNDWNLTCYFWFYIYVIPIFLKIVYTIHCIHPTINCLFWWSKKRYPNVLQISIRSLHLKNVIQFILKGKITTWLSLEIMNLFQIISKRYRKCNFEIANSLTYEPHST
jgi:hypothetical protein